MKNEEIKLFKSLCKFKSNEFPTELLSYATPTILGQLFFNRMQGIAYGTLKNNNALSLVNREFRNALAVAFEQNIQKNSSYAVCLDDLVQILSKSNSSYAMLKGAVLCDKYPIGYRTSNDVDILVSPYDVTEIGAVLNGAGFVQGSIKNDQFVPATRLEIIESKMMRGETVPYIKEINLPGMKYFEVDINFSLDYKAGDTDILQQILNKRCFVGINGTRIPTLDYKDFFIHLCWHLFKEATTLPWIEMKRDMTLYKYCDIYWLLSQMDVSEVNEIFKRATEYNAENICAFAIIHTAELFDLLSSPAIVIAYKHLSDEQILHTVISPKDNKHYIYQEKDITKRFLTDNRTNLLKEISQYEEA